MTGDGLDRNYPGLLLEPFQSGTFTSSVSTGSWAEVSSGVERDVAVQSRTEEREETRWHFGCESDIDEDECLGRCLIERSSIELGCLPQVFQDQVWHRPGKEQTFPTHRCNERDVSCSQMMNQGCINY